MTKELFILSLKRAAWTFLQVVASMITVGVAIQEIEWFNIASIAATAAVYSFVKSMVVGVPENETDGTIIIDNSNEVSKWYFNFSEGTTAEDLEARKNLRFTVKQGKMEGLE